MTIESIKWEVVENSTDAYHILMYRRICPGGWLYKNGTDGPLTFVPNPTVCTPEPQAAAYVPEPLYGTGRNQMHAIDVDFTIVEETPTEGTA